VPTTTLAAFLLKRATADDLIHAVVLALGTGLIQLPSDLG